MNKSKLFFALFSLMGPVTLTQVNAMPAPATPANEQSIRAMIQKIEADAKELAQLPSLKAEAAKLLAEIQQATAPVLGVPGTNNVMRNKAFSDHLASLETKFKHPKEIATQVQRTISEVAAQIAASQNPVVKAALNGVFNSVKQKIESLNSPISEIEGLFAKIKEELIASSGRKDPRNGFKPNKPVKPEEHQKGLIIPEDYNPPSDDSTEAKDIVAILKAIWEKAQAALNIIKDNKLVNHQFPQVTDANVAEFAKAYNQQVAFVSTLTHLLTSEVKAQITATAGKAVANGLVKAAADKLYKFIGTLRSDLVAVPQAHKELAKSKNHPLTDIPAEKPLEKLLGEDGKDEKDPIKDPNTTEDISQDFAALGLSGKPSKITADQIKAATKILTDAVQEFSKQDSATKVTIDAAIEKAFNAISTATDKKAALTAFEGQYTKALKALTSISADITKLPAILKAKKKLAETKDLDDAQKAFKALKSYAIFKPSDVKSKNGKKTTPTGPSAYQKLKDANK